MQPRAEAAGGAPSLPTGHFRLCFQRGGKYLIASSRQGCGVILVAARHLYGDDGYVRAHGQGRRWGAGMERAGWPVCSGWPLRTPQLLSLPAPTRDPSTLRLGSKELERGAADGPPRWATPTRRGKPVAFPAIRPRARTCYHAPATAKPARVSPTAPWKAWGVGGATSR